MTHSTATMACSSQRLCSVTRGIVQVCEKQTIYRSFHQLMQWGYLVRILVKLGSRYSSMSEMNENVGGGGSYGTEGVTHMEQASQVLLAGEGFISLKGTEPFVDEKMTIIPAFLFQLSVQQYLLKHERIDFMRMECWSMERRLVHMAYLRARLHLALQKMEKEKGEKRGILFDWKKSHQLIKKQILTIQPIKEKIAVG
ncbi:uncharacterized protein MONOS_12308 [Monocercomonoides exilis]|uniref:uncharacterized protein n=1 Tax=Monocercomonoides exilis TaxID=2049356 RepID=UPI003559FB66|nr:hypothetical protein MONOS_12308 [Monocercomonoides exilis]|eukprot:MONOS_12308.1-p1 / transcript=MONOS_12308.1 / gene=MONOS_12308 / organism=Monocercomonoides_exilis_PA203 / gene_product=unspecified product / transcript_product=unspecified product / location=Mono_scaffold00673:35554-36457(-) / protein_length=198 / sequence_SO=supercontig / SO=protein_coding / is_pseudo=false